VQNPQTVQAQTQQLLDKAANDHQGLANDSDTDDMQCDDDDDVEPLVSYCMVNMYR